MRPTEGRSRERIRTRSRERDYRTAGLYNSDDEIDDHPIPKSVPRSLNPMSLVNDSTTTIVDGEVHDRSKEPSSGRSSHHSDRGNDTGESKREPEREKTTFPSRSDCPSTASVRLPTYCTHRSRVPLPTYTSTSPRPQPQRIRPRDHVGQSNHDRDQRSRDTDNNKHRQYDHVRGTETRSPRRTHGEERSDDDLYKASVRSGNDEERHQPHNNAISREAPLISGAQSRPRRPIRTPSPAEHYRRRAPSFESSNQLVKNQARDVIQDSRNDHGGRPRGREVEKVMRKVEKGRYERKISRRRSRKVRESEGGCMGGPGYEFVRRVWDWWRRNER